jgi:hypothetical protein
VYISVNNNTNFNFLKILSNYTIWDRLSQKTISRYCLFKWHSYGGVRRRQMEVSGPGVGSEHRGIIYLEAHARLGFHEISHHMDRQACTRDTELVKSREMGDDR